MSATENQLNELLDSLGIGYETVWHIPVFTADDSLVWKDIVPGLHLKNLFMENKHGDIWLIVMPAFERADLNKIFKQLGCGRLSFCKSEKMLPILGVPPGSATPLALMNESAKGVSVALDRQIFAADKVNVHPLHNEASTVLKSSDLLHFLRYFGFEPHIIDVCKADDFPQ